ncbi:MAG TPA: hypothetical protein VGL24_13445 [Chthoniobacterales bacterium]|jgi:succinyl-CoA synthetase alpha subunit
MAILIDETKRVLVQGITGREGLARTRLNREYRTKVLGGVTPGKGGQSAALQNSCGMGATPEQCFAKKLGVDS